MQGKHDCTEGEMVVDELSTENNEWIVASLREFSSRLNCQRS